MPHLHHAHHGYFSMSAGGKAKRCLQNGLSSSLMLEPSSAEPSHANTPIWRDLLTPLYLCYQLSHLIISKSLSIQPNCQLMIKHSICTTGPVWERGGRTDWEKPLIVGQSEKLPHLATMTVKYEFVERLWATTFAQPQSGTLLRHFDSIFDHHKLLKIKKKEG